MDKDSDKDLDEDTEEDFCVSDSDGTSTVVPFHQNVDNLGSDSSNDEEEDQDNKYSSPVNLDVKQVRDDKYISLDDKVGSDTDEDEDTDDKWCLKNQTLVFSGTSIKTTKAISTKQIKKNKYQLKIEDNKQRLKTMTSTTNVFLLLTVYERCADSCRKPKLTNHQRLYLISFLHSNIRTGGALWREEQWQKQQKLFHVAQKQLVDYGSDTLQR